jgi:hypothetical protein
LEKKFGIPARIKYTLAQGLYPSIALEVEAFGKWFYV